MPSLLISTGVVVLDAGEAVSISEYLFRALVYLLAFAGLGVSIFRSIRVIETVHSEISRRMGVTDNERWTPVIGGIRFPRTGRWADHQGRARVVTRPHVPS
jgi:hypothetical protein